MNYIIGVKPGDHKYLFDWIGDLKPIMHSQETDDRSGHVFKYYEDVPLNDANHGYRVNVLEYCETKKSGKELKFSWVTSLTITADNVYIIMRAGRARWRIENETFNTLKTQGYHFEHNYGHGNENLCSVMTMLMMLAFFIDQGQQLCCKVYFKARKHVGSFRVLFEKVRVLIELSNWESWHDLYQFIGEPKQQPPPGTKGGIAYNI